MSPIAAPEQKRTDRITVVRSLARHLGEAGVRWALQGTPSALPDWLAADDGKDLDLWVASDGLAKAEAVLASAGGVRIAFADDPRRLRHSTWWLDVGGRAAVVDLTVGALAVGPVVLCPEEQITTATRLDIVLGVIPVLSGAAGAMDLVARPLLRGRIPETARLQRGREAWSGVDPRARRRIARSLASTLGRGGRSITDVLTGGEPTPRMVARLRRALARRSAAPGSLVTTWRQRWAIVPSRRGVGPAGIRTSGALVVFVGTDGSGKSTLADEVGRRLDRAGFTVRDAYFGMARGNLPGVGLARRLLGVAPQEEAPAASAEPAADPGPVSHPRLRSVAAWYYAVEYGWRWLTDVAVPIRRGEIVVCDRYVYDLRWSPSPGSRAAAVAQRLVGRPDVLVLPDAPPAQIHARKPERTVADIRDQQEAFRALLAEDVARVAAIVADTSGVDPDPAAPIVTAVIAAAHRRTAPAR